MMRMTTAALACLSLTLGCTAEIDGQPPSGGAGLGTGGLPAGQPPGAGQTGMAGSPVSSPATCSNAATDVDFTPLRRLTNAEYLNTVSDLLGDVSALNLDFAAELTTPEYPFRNKAAEQQTPPLLAHQYLSAAEKIAAETVANRLASVLTCDPASAGEQACATTFVTAFASKAFRRPVDAEQTQALLSVWQVGRDTGDFKTGVEAVIAAILQMPEFLYRFELSAPMASQKLVPLDGWDIATRLSYLLWNSSPDDALFAAAQAGQLLTAADVATQVERMLKQPRAREMVARFHEEWLQLGRIDSLEKDPAAFPSFSPQVAGAMQQELRAFVDAAVWQGDGKVATLFTAPYTFMNATLGKFYGVAGLSPMLTRVDQAALGGRPASGILTMGGILASYADRNNTSPTHRGAFVRKAFLCEGLPPPPANANIVPPVPKPNQTRRQAMVNHAQDPTCAACHQRMDPIGFGFEGFDASGAWRTSEAGQTVDASGSIVGSDVSGNFNGPSELGAKLAASDQVLACATTQWFRYAFGRDVGADIDGDQCALAKLHDALKNGGALALVRAIPETAPFMYRKVPEGGL
jgi:hypothetical protein